ncbi:MAG: VanW family protein [Acidimicrobiales bacterium]
MDEQMIESSPDARSVPGRPSSASAPAHLLTAPSEPALGSDPERGRSRRRWLVPALLAPFILFGMASIAWAVDTSSGGVPRNVELAGVDVGGLSRLELTVRVAELAEVFASTPVEVVSGDETYSTTAAEIGLRVDEDLTVASALDAGHDGSLIFRPVHWMRSFFGDRDVPFEVLVDDARVAAVTTQLEGEARVPPTEPTVELADGSYHVVAGVDGTGIDPGDVASALPAAAADTPLGDPIRIEVEQGPIPPLASDDEARAAEARAEDLVDEPIVLQTGGGSRTIESDQLHTWVVLVNQPDGRIDVDVDPAKLSADLRAGFADIDGHPVDAGFTLEGGVPVIIPDRPGKVCCTEDSATRILTALRDGTGTVALDLLDGPATFTVEEAKTWGVNQPVGGSHAWRNGGSTTDQPGFTTYHAAGGARVANIHRIADLVRGAVVPPGGTFSINDHVGRRTSEKGFVPAGAIANGVHVDEVGGGISQFATTTFNAAYFAGLEIDEYQAHSEYFDRYPRGREATMGYPEPDLAFTNNTPYGILIWTSYTDTSLTVTLYSTPHATAEQTDLRETTEGRCQVVVTTRTRTFPDGHTEDDQFRARYRPGEGQSC